MAKLKIERNNISVHGHSGHGRITLIGKNTIEHLTDNQAAPLIGSEILRCANRLLYEKKLDFREFGVEFEITFKAYKRNGKQENNT